MNKRTVFASYSHEDGTNVLLLVTLMRSIGTDIFKDSDSILPGTKWHAEIHTALEESESILVFWSKNSAKSKYVTEEYSKAISLDKRVIPILLDSTPLSYPLSEYQYVDLRKLWKETPRKPESPFDADSFKSHLFLTKRLYNFDLSTPVERDITKQLNIELIKELLPAAIALKAKVGIQIGENK